MAGESKTSPRRIEAVDSQAKALEMRRSGATYDAIAVKLGYADASGAFRAVEAALAKTLAEPAESLRQLERDRLDALQAAVWPKAIKGNLGPLYAAIRISESRRKLLGLDAPLKLSVELDLVIELVQTLEASGMNPSEVFEKMLARAKQGAVNGR